MGILKMFELARSAATSLPLVSLAPRHRVLATSLWLLALGVAEVGAHIGCHENRQAIAAIMRSLQRGMTRSEAEAVLSRHEAHFFVRRSSPESLVWCADAGGARAWRIEISFFSDDRLKSARLRAEDGSPRPKGMPPDIF